MIEIEWTEHGTRMSESAVGAVRVCREHGVRVLEVRKPSRAVKVGNRLPAPVVVGYACPASPGRVLREDEVVDPDS
ncbi:hypothetical protein WJX64_00760 [Leifsonia sp. YIM 134122]|uniref:Uncharacterized protein n=1 Tax=Leifsonia stereocauli TaxID=3134136 RepID=A0ABU9VZ97_9MICO